MALTAPPSPPARRTRAPPKRRTPAQKKKAGEDSAVRSYIGILTARGRLPHKRAIIAVLRACTPSSVEALHAHVVKTGLEADRFVASTLVCTYFADGHLDSAWKVFNGVSEKDLTLHTTMLTACAENGDLRSARVLFDEIPQKDIVAWNAMLSGYARCGFPEAALELFEELQISGFIPNEATLVSALFACSQCACLALGEWVHVYINRASDVALTPILVNSLVNMYAKCGRLGAAFKLFLENGLRNLESWNTMLSSFATHGCGASALSLFSQMIKMAVVPDRITFLAVLMACVHVGMVEHALSCFDSMKRVYGVDPLPEHYGCLVDVLSRRGHLQEARALIKSMPFEPDAYVWGALLAGCCHHHNFEIGLEAANFLVELEPWEEGRYISLSNIYAMSGNKEDSIKVRREMANLSVQRSSGSSLVEVDGVLHTFVAGDWSHPHLEDIYIILESIASNLG